MRKVCCMLAAFMLVTLVLPAQDYSKDVKDLDSIIEALYGSISGEKDEAPLNLRIHCFMSQTTEIEDTKPLIDKEENDLNSPSPFKILGVS